jgi:hypothetical protein
MLRMVVAQQCFGLSDALMDATLIAAPPSTKNGDQARDPWRRKKASSGT